MKFALKIIGVLHLRSWVWVVVLLSVAAHAGFYYHLRNAMLDADRSYGQGYMDGYLEKRSEFRTPEGEA